MLVGLVVAMAVLLLSLLMLDMERDAWLKSQAAQAEVLVERLGEELKLPMLSGTTEVDPIVDSFVRKVPTVMGVYLTNIKRGEHRYGQVGTNVPAVPLDESTAQVRRLASDQLWFAKRIVYAGTTLGVVAVRFSEQAWEELASRLVWRLLLAALVVIALATVVVFWLAGRMSHPLEALAHAAGRVAAGDLSVSLPVTGNDELSDAVGQFNRMVKELAHKEEMRDIFGRYLNPELVADVFAGGGVRKLNRQQEVTVLFADMVGFTEFSESTATEEVVEVLNRHFEVFHRIIAYYGGHVDKYIGDAVMAVFNHPKVDKEHARHAAMASLAMVGACSRLGILRPNGEPITFRVGLNRGQAIVGSIGAAERLEYTVIGDTVNTASRMAGLAAGGEVILSRASFAKLGRGFHFGSLGTCDIKGVSTPMECGRLTATGKAVRRDIEHAVALAFDATLPSEIRQRLESEGG